VTARCAHQRHQLEVLTETLGDWFKGMIVKTKLIVEETSKDVMQIREQSFKVVERRADEKQTPARKGSVSDSN
jgi:hypothetical protein